MQSYFESARLKLSPLQRLDSLFILELLNTDGWIRFIGNRNVKNNDDALAYIERISGNAAIAYFVVRLKDNDAALGLITFIKRDYLNHHDIGFAFLPPYSKLGYAYEAASAFLKSLTNPPHSHIQAVTIRDNVSSIALLKKLGLQFEKEIEMNNESLQVYSAPTDKLLLL